MSISTKIKQNLNKALKVANLRLDTLTAEKYENKRISLLQSMGYFDRAVFPLISGMENFKFNTIAHLGKLYGNDLKVLMSGSGTVGQFNPDNNFYSSPDAEILYLMVRSLASKQILEIGSGNSTRIVRQAIADGDLKVIHTAIDPAPRSDIKGLVDKMQLCRLEDVDVTHLVNQLAENDILFIDSSHEVRCANDVVKLFCNILPRLSPGVVVHVHDIFLPFDYPLPFSTDYPGWGEQYMLQLLMMAGNYELLWPGYYLQKMRSAEYTTLQFLGEGRAQSFWFKIK